MIGCPLVGTVLKELHGLFEVVDSSQIAIGVVPDRAFLGFAPLLRCGAYGVVNLEALRHVS